MLHLLQDSRKLPKISSVPGRQNWTKSNECLSRQIHFYWYSQPTHSGSQCTTYGVSSFFIAPEVTKCPTWLSLHKFEMLAFSSDVSLDLVSSLTYARRSAFHTNPTAKRLLEIMEKKKTNLCVSVDVTKKASLLAVVDAVGSSMCLVMASPMCYLPNSNAYFVLLIRPTLIY